MYAGPSGEQFFETAPKVMKPATIIFKYPRFDWIHHFERLYALIATFAWSDSATDVDAPKKREWYYEATYGKGDGEFQGDANHQNILTWPYQLGEDFTACMQERNPVPLIIAAHFALLLQNLECS
jgi:hypothetical protein